MRTVFALHLKCLFSCVMWLAMSAAGSVTAQVPDWEWARDAGSKGATSGGQGIAYGTTGQYTIVGYFREVAQFGSHTLISRGGDDLMLVQYDAQGQVLWAASAGGTGDDGGSDIAADSSGNLYVTGRFQHQADFGSTRLISDGGDDLFIAKYSATGSLLWARKAGAAGAEYGRAIAVDAAGNSYVAGGFQGTFTIGNHTLTSTTRTGFLLKCDAQGQVLWAQSLPGSDVAAVATDGQGHVYLSGRLAAANNLAAKYDAAGTLLWTSTSAFTSAGAGQGITTDGNGNVYVTGSFQGAISGPPTVTSQGGYEGFLVKLNAQGQAQWMRSMGGSGDDAGRGIALGPDGTIGITGHFQGPASFETTTVSASSSCSCAELFAAGYDTQGTCQWIRSATTALISTGAKLVFDAAGGICVAGSYELAAGFGNQPALSNYLAAAFTARLTTTFPDLVVSTPQRIQGSYHHVTVTGNGAATLSGPLQVTGAVTVQSGGMLNTNCQSITGPGSFTVEAAAELRVCQADGIALTGATGAVQVSGSRSFSPEGSYYYNGSTSQITGTGLPSQVRLLTVANPAGLSLTNALSATWGVQLTAGNLTLGTRMLTLVSTNAGTAQVDNTGGVINGTVTVQRYIDPSLNAGNGYRHFSSPVRATTVADLATSSFTPVTNAAYNAVPAANAVQPYPTVFGYDEQRLALGATGNFDRGWYSPASASTPLSTMRGYSVQLAPNQMVDFVGELNNGPCSLTLTRGVQQDAGYHLIGNPYPATLDWSKVAVPTGLDNAVYVFQSTGPYAGQYRTYVNGIGNPHIALGQGFMVRVSSGATSVGLTLTNSARSADFLTAPVLNRPATDSRPMLRLMLLNPATGMGDETTLYFQQGASAQAEAPFDAVKITRDSTSLVELSSLTPTRERLSISGLPLPQRACSVPLHLVTKQPGQYSLRVAQFTHLAGIRCVLHDAVTNRFILLQAQSAYRFQVTSPEISSNRFTLHFAPSQSSRTSAKF
jgi:hypothetical protein